MQKNTGLFLSLLIMLCCGALKAQRIDTICAGSEPQWYVVDEQPGSRYQWKAEGGTMIGSAQQSTAIVQWPQVVGLYKLSVTEKNGLGCEGDPVVHYVYVKRKFITVSAPTEACFNTTVKMSVSGGMSFKWSTGDSQSTTQVRILSDTLVTVIVKDTVCSITTDTFQVLVKVQYPPRPEIDDPNQDIYKGQTIDIRASGDSIGKKRWEVQKGFIRSRNAGGVKVNFTDTGNAYVKLVVTNIFGCSDSAEREVHVKGEHVYLPNAFTPDGDGLNDRFKPYGTGIKKWSLEIYNRWGQLIFSGNETGEGWNGTFQGIPVPADGYIYLCEGSGFSGKLFALKGTITVLR